MEKSKTLIAAVQETKLTSKSKQPTTPNYTFVRQYRGVNKGGGLGFLVHKDVSFTLLKTPPTLEQDPHLETLTISIPGEQSSLNIRNVYLPPVSSCNTPNYVPPLNELTTGLGDNYYVLGDVNAHHTLWHSGATNDARGEALADVISNQDCAIINLDQPTRVANNSATAPDVSIASISLLPTTNWKVENKLNSDHLPITISVSATLKKFNSKPQTFINFSKADWPKFQSFTEKEFSKAKKVDNIHEAENFFRTTLQKASKRFIPAGRIPTIYNALPTEAAKLIDERDEVKKNNPADARLPDLNKNINNLINEHKKKKWQEHLGTCDPGSKKLWNTIKSLGNQPQQPNNQGIEFNNKTYTHAKHIADQFNRQYTPDPHKKPQQPLRRILCNIKEN